MAASLVAVSMLVWVLSQMLCLKGGQSILPKLMARWLRSYLMYLLLHATLLPNLPKLREISTSTTIVARYAPPR